MGDIFASIFEESNFGKDFCFVYFQTGPDDWNFEFKDLSKQEGTPWVTSPQTLGKMNQELAQETIFLTEN